MIIHMLNYPVHTPSVGSHQDPCLALELSGPGTGPVGAVPTSLILCETIRAYFQFATPPEPSHIGERRPIAAWV